MCCRRSEGKAEVRTESEGLTVIESVDNEVVDVADSASISYIGAVIAIDPGVHGFLAGIDVAMYKGKPTIARAGLLQMPKSIDTLFAALYKFATNRPWYIVVEDVGRHVQGNNASASASFAYHCGVLSSTLYLFSRFVIMTGQDLLPPMLLAVKPNVWISGIGVSPGLSKAERKDRISDYVSSSLSGEDWVKAVSSIPKAASDAIAIGLWFTNKTGLDAAEVRRAIEERKLRLITGFTSRTAEKNAKGKEVKGYGD